MKTYKQSFRKGHWELKYNGKHYFAWDRVSLAAETAKDSVPKDYFAANASFIYDTDDFHTA